MCDEDMSFCDLLKFATKSFGRPKRSWKGESTVLRSASTTTTSPSSSLWTWNQKKIFKSVCCYHGLWLEILFGKGLGSRCNSWHVRFPWLAPELRWGKAWVRWDTRSGFWGVLEWRCAARTSGRLWRWLLGRRLTNGAAWNCQYPGVVINYFYNPQKSTIIQSLGKSISYFRLQLMRT